MKAQVEDDTGCYVVAGSPGCEQPLAMLQGKGLLDAGSEESLNTLARLAAMCLETPIAIVTLSNRLSNTIRPRASDVSCKAQLLPFCAHAIAIPTNVMVVQDARRDPRFADNPLVTAHPGIAFIAAAPLLAASGETVGALCIADYRKRDFSERERQMLLVLAAQVMEQLELRGSLRLLEAKVVAQSSFVENMKRDQQELQKQNATDPLTGLGNRRSFHDRLCLEIARAECTGSSAALLVFDVDHFKSYNDSFGHPAGDAVLKQLSDLVLLSCRDEDFAARIGGEEFAMILPGTNGEEAAAFADWLRRRVQRQNWPHRAITISVGVGVAQHAESGLQLAARADVALYRSKRDGRNRVTMSEGHGAG